MTTKEELTEYADRINMEEDLLEWIEHHGVEGQKWGVRRAAKKAAAQEHKDWAKNAMSSETANAVFQRAEKSFRPVVAKVNNDPMFKGKDLTKDHALAKQYDAVLTSIFNQHMTQASADLTMNKTGDRVMHYQFDRARGLMRASEARIQVLHADVVTLPDFKVIFNENGFVVGIQMVSDELQQSEDEILDFLEHHGVKGQRWGVRRSRGNRGAFKRQAAQDHVKKMSNEELRTAVARMQLEKQFNDLSKQQNKSVTGHGAKFASDILKDVGKQHARKLVVEGVGAIGTVLTAVFIANKMSG